MNKKELRIEFKEKRKQLNDNDIKRMSIMMAKKFFELYDPEGKTIHIFLSIPEQKEVDTSFIWSQLLNNTIKTVISKSNFSTYEMEHFEFTQETELVVNSYHIPEPVNGERAASKDIDLVIIPILAFDKKGHRVGYGKGFYDRFLASCSINCLKVGLSFFDPVDEISNVASTDISLDYCITPKKIYDWAVKKG